MYLFCTYGFVSPGGKFALFLDFSLKVWKLAVTKPEEQPLSFQLILRDLITYITRKNCQVTRHHYTSLHYTRVYPHAQHYTTSVV